MTNLWQRMGAPKMDLEGRPAERRERERWKDELEKKSKEIREKESENEITLCVAALLL